MLGKFAEVEFAAMHITDFWICRDLTFAFDVWVCMLCFIIIIMDISEAHDP